MYRRFGLSVVRVWGGATLGTMTAPTVRTPQCLRITALADHIFGSHAEPFVESSLSLVRLPAVRVISFRVRARFQYDVNTATFQLRSENI